MLRIMVICYQKSFLMLHQLTTHSGPLSILLQGKNWRNLTYPRGTMGDKA